MGGGEGAGGVGGGVSGIGGGDGGGGCSGKGAGMAPAQSFGPAGVMTKMLLLR